MRGINIPFELKIDSGLIKNLHEIIVNGEINTDNILIISGSGPTSYIASKVCSQLNRYFKVNCLEIESNKMDTVLDINKEVIFDEITLIIGIGGGKVLDVCKYVAHMARVDFVSIPTSLAHDGIASPIAVIDVGNHVKSLGCSIPNLVIVDLDIIVVSPTNNKKAGVGDILSNYTAIYDWKLAAKLNDESIDDFALMLSEVALNSIINHKSKDLDDILFLREIAHSIILSGLSMEIAGNSRPCSGSEHLFSHALDQLSLMKLPHGIQVAIGSVMSAYMQGQDFEKQIEFLKTFNIPYSPKLAGIPEGIALLAWLSARKTRKNRFTVLDTVEYENPNYFLKVIRKINKY